jgi:hypothetical protein
LAAAVDEGGNDVSDRRAVDAAMATAPAMMRARAAHETPRALASTARAEGLETEA